MSKNKCRDCTYTNCTLPLKLIHTDTIITFDAYDFPRNINIYFKANYTIFNSGDTTKISFILPFSLAIHGVNPIIDVLANNTHISYDLFDATPWNENLTDIDVSFLPRWINIYPITLIRSNITLLNNSTVVLQYNFSCSLSSFFPSGDETLITYYLGSWQGWNGTTGGRLELIAYGKEPIFSPSSWGGGGDFSINPKYVEIEGGRSFSYDWFNIKSPLGSVGARYYKTTQQIEIIWNIIVFQLLPFIGIAIIVIIVVVRKKRNKREFKE